MIRAQSEYDGPLGLDFKPHRLQRGRLSAQGRQLHAKDKFVEPAVNPRMNRVVNSTPLPTANQVDQFTPVTSRQGVACVGIDHFRYEFCFVDVDAAGLGLALSRRLAGAAGGSVRCDGAADGAAFVVALPAA